MIENVRALLKKTIEQAHEQLWYVCAFTGRLLSLRYTRDRTVHG